MQRIRTVNIFIAFLFFLAGCSTEQSQEQLKTVHDFRLPTLEHGRFYLNEHSGKTVLLVFWATYCQPCKAELTALNELYQSIPADRTTLAAICIDPENIDEVNQIISGLNINYPILLDYNSGIFKKLGLNLTPTTILIAPGGNVVLNQGGYDHQIKKQIQAKTQQLLDGNDS